jgi:hypothetical protein
VFLACLEALIVGDRRLSVAPMSWPLVPTARIDANQPHFQAPARPRRQHARRYEHIRRERMALRANSRRLWPAYRAVKKRFGRIDSVHGASCRKRRGPGKVPKKPPKYLNKQENIDAGALVSL